MKDMSKMNLDELEMAKSDIENEINRRLQVAFEEENSEIISHFMNLQQWGSNVIVYRDNMEISVYDEDLDIYATIILNKDGKVHVN